MSFVNFMNKVRYWDNQAAKWLMRHSYFMFFQLVLFGIFVVWFINTTEVIDTNYRAHPIDLERRIQVTQSIHLTIIVLLMLLNSFWMLYIFNIIQKLQTTLKDVSFNIMRMRNRNKED